MNTKPWTLLGSAALILSLLVACGPALATPTPQAEPTAAPAAAPTDTPQPAGARPSRHVISWPCSSTVFSAEKSPLRTRLTRLTARFMRAISVAA